MAGADALAHDGARAVFAQVNHLCARIGLLPVVGQRHTVELAYRMVALEYTTRVFPGNGATCFDLGPRQLAVVATAQASLGHQVVDAALTVLVAGVPVLDGTVLDFGTVLDDNLDDSGMQLVLVTHGGSATLEIGDIGIVIGNDERTLKLARLCRIDAEIGGQFHRATHALGNIDKRAVAEDCRIQGSIEIVGIRHHFAQVLAHQVRIVLHRLADGAEDDAQLGQSLAIGRLDAHAVHHGVHSHTAQSQLFLQRDAQLVECLLQFRVNLLFLASLLLSRSGIVADVLIVDSGHMDMAPRRSLQGQPVAVGFQAEFQQPLGLTLQGGDAAHHILVKSLGDDLGLNVGHKAVLVLGLRRVLYDLIPFFRFFVFFHWSN